MTNHMTDEATKPKPKRTRPDLWSGRTKPWGTKLSEDWVEKIREICHRDKIKANDLVERAVAAYEREAGTDLITAFAYVWERASKDQRAEIARMVVEREVQ